MLTDCFIFILNNKFHFILALLIVVVNIFVMVKLMKTTRKNFLHKFFGTAVFCIILDIIYHVFHVSKIDLSDMGILQKIFHFIFSLLEAYVFFIVATVSLLYMMAFLVAYIVLTIHEKKKGG